MHKNIIGLESAYQRAKSLKPYSNMAISAELVIDMHDEILTLRQRVQELETQVPKWISVDDRLPGIDYSKPKYSRYVSVICTDGKSVRQLRYISNALAKTEKGREPRFEEVSGRLALMSPTRWMPFPLPQPPKENPNDNT